MKLKLKLCFSRRFVPSFQLSSKRFTVYFIFLISYFTLFHILNIKWIQQLNNNAENNTTESNLSLRRLSVWLDQPFDRLKYLNIVCDAVKGKKQQEAQ